MKSSILALIVLSVLAPEARADGATAKVFAKIAGKTVVGRNNVTGSPCAISVPADEPTSFQYSWHTAEIGGELGGYNSISAGHFTKQLFARRLVHKEGGGLGCLIGGRCYDGSLEISYDSKRNILSLEDYYEGRLTNSCVFN